MTSRFVTSIDSRIAAASDGIERGRLEALKANFLARQGETEAAANIVASLRIRFGARPDAGVSASLHLVEGLLAFFRDLSPAASEKFQRAHALAAAAKVRPVEALAAAWLAHMDFSAHRFESMGANLVRAFEAAEDNDHAALSRCSSVCAVALHLSRNFVSARHWYQAARLHGLEDGDGAATSAYMHNQVAMSVMSLRQSLLSGDEDDVRQIDELLGEARSARDYDEMTGASSLTKLLPILKANLLSLRGQPGGAVEIYEQELREARAQGMERLAPWLLADMASCYLRLQRFEEALKLAREAEEQLGTTPGLQTDDEAAARSRLAEVFAVTGDVTRADELGHQARQSWARFRALQDDLAQIATSIDSRFRCRVMPRT